MFKKIRNAMLALAAVATLGLGTLVSTTDSADARGFGGGGGFHAAAAASAAVTSAACATSAAAASTSAAASISAIACISAIASASAIIAALPPALVPSLVQPLPRPRPLAASAARRRAGGCGDDLRGCSGCGGAAALHLPDQGIHAGQPRGVQGRVHEGSRLGADRQHASAAADAAGAAGPAASALTPRQSPEVQNPGFGRGSLLRSMFRNVDAGFSKRTCANKTSGSLLCLSLRQ